MEDRLKTLEEEVADLRTQVSQIRSRDFRRAARNRVIRAVMLGCGAVVGIFLYALGVALPEKSESLPRVSASSLSLPALDSFVTWARRDVVNAAPGYTTEVLSLIGEGSEQNSYLWPLYVELRGTTNDAATIKSSQSAGTMVRALVRSSGSPWTAGFHSEIAHGRESLESGKIVATKGTSILFNGEMRSYGTAGETIGVNLQCVYSDANSKECDHAINIQAGSASTTWRDGIHFDSAGSYNTGKVGINFDQSRYHLGLDLANNSMKLNGGQKISLEESGAVFIWYNPATRKVEIIKGGSVVASF
jgi:hypothetical protein